MVGGHFNFMNFVMAGALETEIFRDSHPVKIDLNKKLDPTQKTIQTLNIDA